MTNTIQSIADQINNFDYFYEMSDDNSKYENGTQSEKEIKSALSKLTTDQIKEVRTQVTVNEEWVNRYFAQFFQGSPETTPEQVEGQRAQDNEEMPSEAKKQSFRAIIFQNAWAMLRKGLFSCFSSALKAAWSKFKLVRSLRNGIAYFSFRKASGELREAIGTLAGNNYHYERKGAYSANKPELVKFWDVQKRAFRSCRVDRLVEVSQ